MPSYDDIREDIHPYTTLLIRINRKFDENADRAQLQHFLNEMNNMNMNVQLLSILYREPTSKFETREKFEIFSEYEAAYSLDRILEYKVR